MNGRMSLLPMAAATIALLATPASGADKNKPAHLFGPEPSWDQFRTIAEAGVRERMIDPESARITWKGGFFKGEYKPFLSARVEGYIACGSVNARNRLGGYTGATTFVVVIDYDRVLLADIDGVAGGMVAQQCLKASAEGRLPPVPGGATAAIVTEVPTSNTSVPATAGSAPATPVTVSSASSGLTLRAMPDGAYVASVAPASLAALAGLKPGMVVASVNAIPLAGMGDAMLKVVDAAGPAATLAIVGGKTVKLGARP
jgi:hypothetical protein